MALHTRRGLLLGAAGLLAGLAGCNEDPGDAPSPPSPTEPGQRPDPNENGVSDPERQVLRAPDGPVAWFVADADDAATRTLPADERTERGLIAGEATAATLSLADVGGREAARAFVDGTDFDSETIYLDQSPVGECYRLVLCSAGWGDDRIRLRYARVLRDYDVPCEADERDTQATFVRLPVALDASDPWPTETDIGTAAECGQSRIPPEETPTEESEP